MQPPHCTRAVSNNKLGEALNCLTLPDGIPLYVFKLWGERVDADVLPPSMSFPDQTQVMRLFGRRVVPETSLLSVSITIELLQKV